MKVIKFFAVAAALAIAGTASAQFSNGGGKSTMAGDYTGYNRFGISYDNTSYGFNKQAGGDDNNFSTNGFGLNYIHGFSLTQKLPLYLETGINANFNFSSTELDDDGDETLKFQNINFQVPVNLTYRFAATEDFTIAPYLGLNLKLNIVGRERIEYDDDDDDDDAKWYSVYSKKDMGGKDETWNRFQMGWHVGVGFQYKPIYLGVQYGTDFIAAYSHKKAKINNGNLKLTVAYCF